MKKIKKLLFSVMVTLLVLDVMPEGIFDLNTRVEVQAATTVGTPKLVSAKASGTTSAKVYWERVSGVSGYRIYRKTDGTNWKAVKTISGNRTSSYTDSKLKAGTRYFYTVRAYKNVNGKTVWGKYNTRGVYTVTGLEMPLFIVSYKTEARDVIDVSIGKYNGSTSFIIYRKEKENDNWKKIGTTTRGSTKTVHYIDRNVNPEINYIYTVKGYCTYDGKKYYSNYRTDGRRCYEGSGFKYSEYNINKGTVVDVKQYTYDNRNIAWESADERIATIDSKGILRGVNFGKTEIKAIVDGKTYTSKVNVNRTIEVDKSDIICSKPTDITVYLCTEENGFPTYNIENTSVLSCTWGEGHYDKTEYGWCCYWKLTINPRTNGFTKIRLTNSINNEETVLNVTVTGMQEQASVKANYEKLRTYIQTYGNTYNGNKYIAYVDGKRQYAILYDASKEQFEFSYIHNDVFLEGVTMTVNPADDPDIQIDYVCNHNTLGGGFWTQKSLKASAYNGHDMIFRIMHNTSGLDSKMIQSSTNISLQLGFLNWEYRLLKYAGLTYKDLGFTSYR